MIPPLEQLETLTEPFEILELIHLGTIEVRPVAWKLGKAVIRPRDGRAAHEVPILRLTVDKADKPTLPYWWDVTSKTLIAGLLGYLDAPNARRWRFIIQKFGEAPTARFSLEAKPVSP